MFLTILAAALLGSGVAEAAGTLKASDYPGDAIVLSSTKTYDKLVVNVPLTLTGVVGCLDLYSGTTIEFQKEKEAEKICSISTSEVLISSMNSVYFNNSGAVYNIRFDDSAQAIVAASAGTPITLISDLNEGCKGFSTNLITLTLNGAVAGGTVEMGGVSFTYVGPQESDYTFKAGEIGFTGYYKGSHALNLVVGGKPTPEPTTGTLSLLALAGLCARRRRK